MTLIIGVVAAKKKVRGFTLIELVFVIFLISLIVTMGVPQLNQLTSVNLRSGGRRMAGLIKYAYSRAIMTKSLYRLVLDAENSKYWLEKREEVLVDKEADEGGSLIDLETEDDESEKKRVYKFVAVSEFLGKPGKLPSGVTIHEYQPADPVENSEGNLIYIIFYPEGSSSGGVLSLKSSQELYVSLTINPLTGNVRTYRGLLDADA